MSAFQTDSQGFLVGQVLDTQRQLLRGQQKELDLLRSIDASLAGRAFGRASRSGTSSRAPTSTAAVALPTVTSPGRTAASAPRAILATISPAGRSSAASRAAAAVIAAPLLPTVTSNGRDARGRFVAGAGRSASGGGGSGSPGQRKPPGDKSGNTDSKLGDIASSVKDMAKGATDNIDPTIQAAKEIKETISPLGRGWKAAFGRSAEQKKERWYKRILAAVTGRKAEGVSGAGGGSSDGGLGDVALGVAARILPAFGAVLGPVLAVVLAGLAAFGIGKLIHGWMVSSGVQDKIFDAIDSMKKVWSKVEGWIDAMFDKVKAVAAPAVDAAKNAKHDFLAGLNPSDAGQGRGSPYDPRRLDGGGEKSLARRAGELTASAVRSAAVVTSPIAKLLQVGAGFNVVEKADGTVVRQKGARNWRNNNPGNIEYGDFAKSKGAIGSDGRFAVFPDFQSGRSAKESLIFEGRRYRDLDLKAAIARYAPPSENDTGAYQRQVLAAVGGSNRPMSTYSQPERTAILDAMQKVEGFKVGATTPFIRRPAMPAIPSSVPTQIAPLPEVHLPAAGADRDSGGEISRSSVVSQNVSDRGIAHIVTGGMGKS